MPIPYAVNAVGAPAGALEDIQDAFLAWQSVVGSPALEADPRDAWDGSGVPADVDAELTMYPGAAPDETKKRDLGAGEILALRELYPA